MFDAKNSKALRYLVDGRLYVTVCLLVVAGFLARFGVEVSVPSANALAEREVTLTYVGSLEKVVSRTGINHGSTTFDGGMGIGIENNVDKDEMLKKLRPVLYVPFASALSITDKEAASLLRAGPALRVTLYEGQVVAAGNASGEVIPFELYANRVQESRRHLLIGAWVIFGIALTYFAAATTVSRKLKVQQGR